MRDDGVAADERVLRDAAELMDARERADRRVVADLDVAGQRRGVGEDDPASDVGVVRDVRVGHEQVVVADPRDPAAALRCPRLTVTYSQIRFRAPIVDAASALPRT